MCVCFLVLAGLQNVAHAHNRTILGALLLPLALLEVLALLLVLINSATATALTLCGPLWADTRRRLDWRRLGKLFAAPLHYNIIHGLLILLQFCALPLLVLQQLLVLAVPVLLGTAAELQARRPPSPPRDSSQFPGTCAGARTRFVERACGVLTALW